MDLKTESVDASVLLPNLQGFRAWARRRYWGFEPKNFPLNARVWYPKGKGPFPLVLIVHGNHRMEEFSDPGPGKPPIDLTIELVTSDNVVARLPLSHICPLQPVLKVTFTKWPYWEKIRYKSATEPVLQTYEIPLTDFAAAAPGFDPGRLKQIRFCFDRTRTAVVLLDQVGFVTESDAASE